MIFFSRHSSLATRHSPLLEPLVLAAILTLANLVKPVAVDDTAYLIHAANIANHPFDPYGFEIHWYALPQPAMTVLLPPVLPYWLALAIHLFGPYPAVLKLWLFPFLWLFTFSLRSIVRRFAPSTEQLILPLIVLSPAVMPMINLMLDIPAAAIGLASIALIIRKSRDHRWLLATASGLLAALAMQTKYTALLVPPLILWYGLTHRRLIPSLVAVAVSVAGFVAWELVINEQAGQSHFLYHLNKQAADCEPGETQWEALFREKSMLIPGLVGHLGLLGVGTGLTLAYAIRVPSRVLAAFAITWAILVGIVAIMPNDGLTPWRSTGTLVLILAGLAAAFLLVRRKPKFTWRRSRDSCFVVGWVMLEIAGYFALTPFPAARRAIGLTIALGILAARTLSITQRLDPTRMIPGWILRFGVATGVMTWAIDTYDAYPEKILVERASGIIRTQPGRGRIWFSGHWGFQYYCEQSGMYSSYHAGPVIEKGDYLVLPICPGQAVCHRPDGAMPLPPAHSIEVIADLIWDDPLAAQTIPSFYGGSVPISSRDYPRFQLLVICFKEVWKPK